MIGFTHPALILGLLCLNILLTEWLTRHTFLRHLGTALLVILVTAATSNLGLIPTQTTPLYSAVFEYVAPVAIFLPLLEVNLRQVLQAGLPMILAFLLGAGATLAGVLVSLQVVGMEAFGEAGRALAGMFVGTYVGGSVNFNALALHYGVTREGTLYAGAVAVDNIVTALWMVLTLALPRLLPRLKGTRTRSGPPPVGSPSQEENLSVSDLARVLGLSLAVLWASEWLSTLLAGAGLPIPSILILSSLALILAQFPLFNRLPGTQVVGMLAIYLFLAVIGALCDLGALSQFGPSARALLIFVPLIVLIHGLLLFTLGGLARADWDMLAVASQANIGGATSALALARSLNRQDLVLPAVLVGSLGYGIGTYLGFLTSEFLVR